MVGVLLVEVQGWVLGQHSLHLTHLTSIAGTEQLQLNFIHHCRAGGGSSSGGGGVCCCVLVVAVVVVDKGVRVYADRDPLCSYPHSFPIRNITQAAAPLELYDSMLCDCIVQQRDRGSCCLNLFQEALESLERALALE